MDRELVAYRDAEGAWVIRVNDDPDLTVTRGQLEDAIRQALEAAALAYGPAVPGTRVILHVEHPDA